MAQSAAAMARLAVREKGQRLTRNVPYHDSYIISKSYHNSQQHDDRSVHMFISFTIMWLCNIKPHKSIHNRLVGRGDLGHGAGGGGMAMQGWGLGHCDARHVTIDMILRIKTPSKYAD